MRTMGHLFGSGTPPTAFAGLAAAALAIAVTAAAAAQTSTIREELLQPGGLRVTFAVPAGYTGATPAPLVVALHFAGKVTPFFGRAYLTGLVEPGLRDLGAVIAAPDCRGRDWTDPVSEADVLALLDDAMRTYRIDPARVLLTGYSMGAMGTWYLAARHQDRFSAALIVSGLPLARAAEIDWRIPLYLIHSRDDERLLLKPTADVVKQLEAKGRDVKLVVVDGLTHYQVSGFVPYLRAAVPWIQKAWRR
jgi:predicted peptidase